MRLPWLEALLAAATVRTVVLQLPVTTVRLPFLTVCVQRVSRAPYCLPWPGQLFSRGLAAVLTDPPHCLPGDAGPSTPGTGGCPRRGPTS
jgi:hypothetical protein